MGTLSERTAAPLPTPGCVVYCRSHNHLVEEVRPPEQAGGDTVVRMACLDDGVNGRVLEVLWEREVDARVLGESSWDTVGQRGFDDGRVFSSYLHTLQWNCVTSTDPGLFQAPLRAGIDVKPYQLEPLRKALRMPRVSLFIADDVGLGKTIEAGLIMRELLLRQKVQRVVVVAPPSVVLQWQGEMQSRFGMGFAVMDRAYVSRMRRERGWGINPWATHTRFILSQALVRNEDYAGPLRDWLGAGERSLLILDEAHNAAPASASKVAIDSKLTRAVRDLAWRFEHKLFLSATPHNGHSNSFSALLEILDPTRFCRGVSVRKADLEPVLVRRLKEDLRQIGVDLPKRHVVPVVLDGLAAETPELKLAELLQHYRTGREEHLKGANNKQRAAELLVVTNLQKRLLSSVEAFRRTLGVHSDTLKRREQGQVLRSASRPDQLGLLQQAIDGDDDRADADEESVLEEADQEHRLAVATAALAVGPSEWALLDEMAAISRQAAHQADARIDYLRTWIRRHLCPDLGQPGARWNGERLLIFTEYADTKRWLEEQLRGLIAGSDLEQKRIATFHGGIGDERREALKRSFNSPPALDPLRILIATDAAREGVNLQNHCRYLFHFDVPWNPGRMEQRNGRIDRTLQRSPEVYCHYFVLPQRPEDRVLDVLVRKTEEIRSALGSLPPVVVGKLNELLAKGINPTAIAAMIDEIGGVDQGEGFKRTQALMSLELEDSRERSEELKAQISRLEKALQKSEQWLHFSSELFRDALNTSLRVSARQGEAIPQLLPKDPAAAAADPERAEWIFPSAKELPGGEHSWGDVLDALRPPRQPGQKLWDWRRDTAAQPVVFKDPQEVNADRVHLHLEHPLVQRLLNRFLVRGFQTDELSRAAVLTTTDDTAKLVLLARLSLYGHGAARLHDEVIELVAEWDPMDRDPADPARRLRVLNATKTDMALADLETSLQQRLPAASPEVQQQLRLGLPADVAQLKQRLEALAGERAAKAQQLLGQRAEAEAAAFVKVLEEQRERILKTRSKYDSEADQLAFSFATDEQAQLRQLRDNRNHWEKRLARIDRDLELEPAAIRRSFAVSTAPRIEPAGAIYLWPLEANT